ncbi:MAG TPA: hypothetical protein VMJ93_13415 [Verrucomicrobiae bacterium]|nr:hypothetical protein [Verrucomicrobiae bacterium]
MNAIWGCLSFADTLVSKWGSESFKNAWDTYWRIPKWGWKVWIIGVFCIAVVFIFEASYRAVRKDSEARARVEQELEDEKKRKPTTDEIVLKEARDGFRSLNKANHGNRHPREFVNEKWVQQVAEKHGLTVREVDEAVDRCDGKFHWQF